jgi:putative endonuclease
MNQPHRQKIGKWGEAAAARYLEARGYRILQHNVRTPYGEIDLIASQESRVVFVEVKTRTSLSYGLPEAAVTRASWRIWLIRLNITWRSILNWPGRAGRLM